MQQISEATSVINRIQYGIRTIGRGLKSGFFLSTVLLILLCVIIWYWGPAFKYLEYAPFRPIANRIIAIGVLVVLWGINNYFLARAAIRKKPKAMVENELKPRDPIEELITILQLSFRSTMKIIKDKWTGKDHSNRTLYAMPWYIILGPSQSGKTSLVLQSELSFPLAHELKESHVNKTIAQELPQYWVTRESVLFDIPGTWLNMKKPISVDLFDDDEFDPNIPVIKTPAKEGRRKLWNAFTDLLNDVRSRRPINGVIITYSILDLIRMSNEQRSNEAMNIHARLVEIAEKLGTRFTVNIVLTKLDKLAGFKEYFSKLSKLERQEPFGFSFPIYSEIDADKWAADFEKKFSAFIDVANNDIIDRVDSCHETEIRKSMYTFLREFTATGQIVCDFFKKALLSDRFSTPPLVRGIYYVSTTQEGAPFNALLTKISNDYHMVPPVTPAYSGNPTPYFNGKLFTDVIFKEAGLAGDNHKVERHKRLVLRSSILASVLILLGFGFLLNETMEDNTTRAENVLSKSKAFIDLPRDVQISGSEAQFLPALDAISSANNEYPGWEDKSDIRRYTALYQGRRVGPEVRKAYEKLLQERFLPSISNKIANEIVRLGQNPETYNSDERLDALRVYLLLGDIQRRKELDDSDDTMSLGKAAVLAWMKNKWQQRFEGQDDIQSYLKKHIEYALNTNRIAAPIDDKLVADTQAALREVPRDVRLYRGLKALAARQVPNGLSLRNMVGPSFDIVFKQNGDEVANNQNDVVVPYFYTKRGFHEFFIPKNKDLSIIAVEDAWVTGERERVRYSEDDLQAFMEKIRYYYATDYINFWHNMIDNLNIVDFRNIDDAVRVLSEIDGPSNPFGRLLNVIKSETEIYPLEPAKTDKEQSQTEIAFDRNREHGLRIARAFSDLSALVTAKEGEKQPLEEMLGTMTSLESYLSNIQSGQQSSKPIALEKAQQRAKLQGDDPIFIVRRTGGNLPKPFDKYFNQIADNSWKVILDAAKIDLQMVWQNNVYRTFNVELAGRYPFNVVSSEDVTLDEFQHFFGPKGEFDNFFNDHLKNFINPNNGTPILIDGQSLSVSDEFIEQIKKIRAIRNIFFNADGVPTLRYTIEPVGMSGNISRSVLNIEGQLIPYSHGPTRPIAILWPNALSSKQDISQVSTAQGASISYSGLWSSFRLFDRATITNNTPDTADVVFNLNGGQIKYRIKMSATDKNPFVLKPLTSMKLPEQL